jgi:hypothetical protein
LAHEQQKKLMDQFRAECKLKGFDKSELMKTNESDVKIVSTKVRRNASIRLIRSGSVRYDNETMYSMSTASDLDEDDNFSDEDIGGIFHEPSSFANNNFEALCGNLSLT